MYNTIMVSVHVCIRGVVQGVFFRMSTQQVAMKIGVTGWVKNCSDGSVEALFEGVQAQVSDMIQWCHRGPNNARVVSVDILDSKDCTNPQEGFTILYE